MAKVDLKGKRVVFTQAKRAAAEGREGKRLDRRIQRASEHLDGSTAHKKISKAQKTVVGA